MCLCASKEGHVIGKSSGSLVLDLLLHLLVVYPATTPKVHAPSWWFFLVKVFLGTKGALGCLGLYLPPTTPPKPTRTPNFFTLLYLYQGWGGGWINFMPHVKKRLGGWDR